MHAFWVPHFILVQIRWKRSGDMCLDTQLRGVRKTFGGNAFGYTVTRVEDTQSSTEYVYSGICFYFTLDTPICNLLYVALFELFFFSQIRTNQLSTNWKQVSISTVSTEFCQLLINYYIYWGIPCKNNINILFLLHRSNNILYILTIFVLYTTI